MHVVEGMFQVRHAHIRRVWHDLSWRSRLRSTRLGSREGIAMDQSVSRRASFYFSQAHKISFREVSIPVFELPESGIWRARVENVADFVKSIHIELPDKR